MKILAVIGAALALSCLLLARETLAAGAYSMADLQGTWTVNSLASGAGAPWWERATINVAGNGSFSGATLESDGTANTVSGTFAITPDGIVTLAGIPQFKCTMDAGKTVFVCTDTWTTGSPGTTEMKVFTKKAASYAQPELAGNWEVKGLVSGPGAPWWIRGLLNIGTTGNFAGTLLQSDGTTEPTAGTMTMTTGGSISSPTVGPYFAATMDAGKTFAAGTDTWTRGAPGTTGLILMTKRAGPYAQSDLTGTWGFNYLSSGGTNVWARGTFTIAADGTLSGTQEVSDGSTRSAAGKMSITTDGIITNDKYASLLCALDADKTVISCVETDTHEPGTGEMSIWTKMAVSAAAPLPAIKANGAKGSVTVSQSTPISITISLDPGAQAGTNADWWVLAQTASTWYAYVYPTGWQPGMLPCVQAALFSLPTFEVLNAALPPGDYTFYYGVDLAPNGVLDPTPLYYDAVQVHVTPQ